MENTAILYPSIVMALFSLALLVSMGLRRLFAIRARAVSMRHYRTYSEGTEPESMRQHSRNVQNQFEVPPLFHLAAWGTYALGAVTPGVVYVAWLFVASRVVHSTIHMTYNNVSHRFLAFGLGLVAVAWMWVRLLLALGTP